MKTIALTAAAILSASPAIAQNSVPVTESRQIANTDPNKLICESEDQIGSRLARHRVCLTAEQWKEKHREHREFTDEIQAGTWGPDSQVQSVRDSPLGGIGPN